MQISCCKVQSSAESRKKQTWQKERQNEIINYNKLRQTWCKDVQSSQRRRRLSRRLSSVQSVMCFQFHDGPLPLRRCSVFWGEAGHCDAGGGVLHGWDELRPAFEGLLLWGQEGLRVQAVTRKGQCLLDKVLGQVELLRHRVYDAQIGLVVWEELPEQAPVPLRKLIAFVTVPSLLFFLCLHFNFPVLVRAVLKGFSHIHLVNGREGFGWSAVMFAGLIQSVTTIVP